MDENFYLQPSRMEQQKVCEVQFRVFKADAVRANAVCAVTRPVTIVNGKRERGGLSDLRMGSTDYECPCETCHMPHPQCPGHFGYHELAEPMYNIGHFDVVLMVIRCVCKDCYKLMLGPKDEPRVQEITTRGMNRLRDINRIARKSKCPFCDTKQPNLGRFTGIYPGLVIRCTEPSGEETRWYGNKTFEVLDKISDEDAQMMGFTIEHAHPRDLLLRVLPIPPPPVRPSVSFGAGVTENELTTKLISIVRGSNVLREEGHANLTNSLDKSREMLQKDLATYFHNASTYYKPTPVSRTSKMTLKSIYERLKGKHGRLRGNLMGKRVNFSARTVITGDPNIDVDEVGVPFSVAMTLTFPERVNHFNKRRLEETVRRTNYPSANAVVKPAGNVFRLSAIKKERRERLTLDIGDIVERHIVDGDVVLFNRQPTLHRMSMMGHRVRVLNFNTFRLNLSCTTPYNADFDGDEMNLHVPQSLLTKSELIEMMMVPKNFVSPNRSAPCMGIVQDSLLGSFRITDKDVFLDKYFVHNIMLWLDRFEIPIPAILKPRPLWTGKQIFSLVLPDVTREDIKKRFSHDDSGILIRQGKMLSGRMTKGLIGASAGSFIHIIFNEHGSDKVAEFINGVQRVTAYYLYTFSFSVGIQDAIAEETVLKNVKARVKESAEAVRRIGARANNRELERKAGMTLLQSFESEVNKELNTCRERVAALVLESVSRRNSFKSMIDSGSKGSMLNICQIAAVVGQQNLYGARIPFNFRRRTLPHFMTDDYGEASRGLVNRGYIEGLRPYEFFFHTIGGREGLIDTAVKTAETGYFQRKLMKAMEDLHTAYDGTVRNANGEVVQFMYGEDGLDGARIESKQSMKFLGYSDAEMEKVYRHEVNSEGWLSGNYLTDEVKRSLSVNPRGNAEKLEWELDQLKQCRKKGREWINMTDPAQAKFDFILPVHVDRAIKNARSTSSGISDLNPVDVIDKVNALIAKLPLLYASTGRGITNENHYSKARVENALGFFSMHLRDMLASRRVIKDYKLHRKEFDHLLAHIHIKFTQSLVQPGEMVGAMTAQSCGEPATQMTLNTFHNAGISSKNVTLGVPRLLELLSVSKRQRNSSMHIELQEGWNARRDRDRILDAKAPCVERAMALAEYTTLEAIVQGFQIIFDPDPEHTVIEEDDDMVTEEMALVTEEEGNRLREASPWIVRLTINGNMARDKDIDMKEIKHAINTCSQGKYFILTDTKPNQDRRVVRLRPKIYEKNDESVTTLKTEIPQLLKDIPLRGIKGITKVFTSDRDVYYFDESTGGVKNKKVKYLDTEGTALTSVWRDLVDDNGNPIYDFALTTSNNIPEIFNALGVEAARQMILLEMRNVYSGYSMSINVRHYGVLVDTMSHGGYLMAMSRVGVNRSNVGPLMRSSFEETVGILMRAAAFGEKDPVRGVSANIILGNQAKLGTGLFDLRVDTALLSKAIPQEKATEGGRGANPYHGNDSVALMESEVPWAKPGANLIHDPSVAGYSNASSSAFASLKFDSVSSGSGAGGLFGAGSTTSNKRHTQQVDVMSMLYSPMQTDAGGLFGGLQFGTGAAAGKPPAPPSTGSESTFRPMDLYSNVSEGEASAVYDITAGATDQFPTAEPSMAPSNASSFGLQSSVPYAMSLHTPSMDSAQHIAPSGTATGLFVARQPVSSQPLVYRPPSASSLATQTTTGTTTTGTTTSGERTSASSEFVPEEEPEA